MPKKIETYKGHNIAPMGDRFGVSTNKGIWVTVTDTKNDAKKLIDILVAETVEEVQEANKK
jgi:hypothetical protein